MIGFKVCAVTWHVEAAHPAIALDLRQHDRFGRDFALPIGRFAADKGFVGFDHLIVAAQWASIANAQLAHCPGAIHT